MQFSKEWVFRFVSVVKDSLVIFFGDIRSHDCWSWLEIVCFDSIRVRGGTHRFSGLREVPAASEVAWNGRLCGHFRRRWDLRSEQTDQDHAERYVPRFITFSFGISRVLLSLISFNSNELIRKHVSESTCKYPKYG